jgi:hypothetical protein
MSRAGHLAGRFFGSLRPAAVDEPSRVWVRLSLTDAEYGCWEKLGRADQAEAIAVGRRAAAALGPDADPRWVAAALCHDVGKAEVGLGPVRRAGATVLAAVVSHGRARTWPNKVGRYINHDEIGAAMLRVAGARPEVAEWADLHHRPWRWRDAHIPPEICEVLARADGERTEK